VRSLTFPTVTSDTSAMAVEICSACWASAALQVRSMTMWSGWLSTTSSAVSAPFTEATAPAKVEVVAAPTGALTRTVIEYPGLGLGMCAPSWCGAIGR